jgi:hypothetical protein
MTLPNLLLTKQLRLKRRRQQKRLERKLPLPRLLLRKREPELTQSLPERETLTKPTRSLRILLKPSQEWSKHLKDSGPK